MAGGPCMGDTLPKRLKNFTKSVTSELGLEGGKGVCSVEKGERQSTQREERAPKRGSDRRTTLRNSKKAGSK